MEITKTKFAQIKYPAMSETKIDGEFVKWDGERFVNERGTDQTWLIHPTYIPTLKVGLIGELYYGEGKSFYSELHSHRQPQSCKVVWFDVDNNSRPYADRRRTLAGLGVPYVQGEVVHSEPEAITQVQTTVAEGYEGIVFKPLGGRTATNWVKIKGKATCNLYVRGIRKDTGNNAKNSLAVGTESHIYGCCSIMGWRSLVELIAGQEIIGENKDYWFVEPRTIVEVEHRGLIHPKRKLRNPIIKRIRDYRDKVKEVV